MSTLTRSERLALLLNLLGDDAASLAQSGIQGDKLEEVEDALADFQEFPPSEDEVNSVLEDFQSYFTLAMQANKTEQADDEQGDEEDDDEEESGPILHVPEEQFEVEIAPTKKFEQPQLTGNTLLDLNRMHPYQVAQALRHERPPIIAIVVARLADEHAAKTLELLPDAIRPGVFLSMAKSAATKPMVLDSVLQTTLQSALLVDQRQEEEESSEKMATLIRALPKPIRTPMLEQLAEEDAELAEAVKKLLYRFEDLKRLQDRDLQKVLGQCHTDVLVVALQKVDEMLLGQVLGNMSKRAKESLQEEMEFKANAREEEIEAGRAEILKILVELDEAGTITIL